MAQLILPTPFRHYAQGKKVVQVTGKTISEALWSFAEQHPEIQRHIFDAESGELRPFVNVFINGEDARNLQGGTTRIEEGDELRIIPNIAGGRTMR